MVQETVTVSAGAPTPARMSRSQTGDVRAGNTGSPQALEVTVAPERPTVIGTFSPDASVTNAEASGVATVSGTAVPNSDTFARSSDFANTVGTAVLSASEVGATGETVTVTGESVLDASENITLLRIVHAIEIAGSFEELTDNMNGVFRHEFEMEGVVEREDQ